MSDVGVWQGIYMCVLFACGAFYSSTATWMLMHWMVDGPNPRLGPLEALFPVRGRWLRYLLAPLLLPAAWAAVWFTAFMLWGVPAPFGLPVFFVWATAAAWRKL